MSDEMKPISRTAAAKLICVSRRTITQWVDADLLPVESTDSHGRPRLVRAAVLKLASEVSELRRRAREKPGLLAEAISRLETETPEWRAEFDELYGPWLRVARRGRGGRVRRVRARLGPGRLSD
jgi:transposase